MVITADVHVAVPQTRNQRSAAAVDLLGTVRNLCPVRWPDYGDAVLCDHDRLLLQESTLDGVVKLDVREGDRPFWRASELLAQTRDADGKRVVLRLLNGSQRGLVTLGQPRKPDVEGKERTARVGPNRRRGIAKATHRPRRDRLS